MKRFLAISAAVLSPLFLTFAASATTYNPQTAFSGSNPSGAWSYGVLSGTTFTPFSTYSANNDSISGLNVWTNSPSGPFPGIFDNTNSSPVLAYGTIQIPGNTLVLHPPNDATFTDLRFTAPSDLVISNIDATFAAADTQGTSTDVHIDVNGAPIFNSTVTGTAGNGATHASSGPYTLLAGQTVDFLVGDGANGYSNDGTSLVASITTAPEPASITLLAVASIGLLGRRRNLSA